MFTTPSGGRTTAGRLSFPKIISGRIDGAVQPGSEWRGWCRIVGLPDARAHLSAMPSAGALDCNTPHKRKELAAAPKWVFPAHPPDQISQATINPRPPCPLTRFQTPKHFEASAMPTQDGLRLDDLHRTKKARPKPRHPDEQHAITATQSETRWCPPQSYAELMAEKQVLGFKPAARLE